MRYHKISDIEAEQFDGSVEMMDKYHIIERRWSSGIREYLLPTLEGELEIWKSDWIATGIDGGQWAIRDDIFKKTYALSN